MEPSSGTNSADELSLVRCRFLCLIACWLAVCWPCLPLALSAGHALRGRRTCWPAGPVPLPPAGSRRRAPCQTARCSALWLLAAGSHARIRGRDGNQAQPRNGTSNGGHRHERSRQGLNWMDRPSYALPFFGAHLAATSRRLPHSTHLAATGA